MSYSDYSSVCCTEVISVFAVVGFPYIFNILSQVFLLFDYVIFRSRSDYIVNSILKFLDGSFLKFVGCSVYFFVDLLVLLESW
jgi:hypothetical protein